MRESLKASTLQAYKQRMLRVLIHIQDELDSRLRLEDLAGIAGFSPYHFHRIFKGMLGESVKSHIRRLRLERAATRLKLTHQAVTFIAFDAGYETLEAFSRAFKRVFGVSPSGFRSRRRVPAPAPAPSRIHYSEVRRLRDFKTVRSGGETMEVTIKTLEPMRVAFLRHVGPYSDVGGTWDRLLATLGKDGWLGGDTLFLGICRDDPEVTPPGKIRYDACVTVDERFVPGGDVGVQVVPGGEYAVTTHIGPYDEVGGTYAMLLGQWLPRSGRELRSSPCFEVYLNDPHGTEPEDLITDLHAPLEPRRGTGD